MSLTGIVWSTHMKRTGAARWLAAMSEDVPEATFALEAREGKVERAINVLEAR